MAYFKYDRFWRSWFYKIISAKDRIQDINLNQLKLKLNNSYKDDKTTTNFEPHKNEDLVNKNYLDAETGKV